MKPVSCRGLVCRLGKQLVLNGVDLEVAEHDSVALIGCSGSGKTTLLRVIAGLEVAEQGDVVINGRLATQKDRILVPPHKRGIAMLFQDLALWPNLTVAGNVRLGLSGLRLSRSESKKRIEQSLELCDISELAIRRPGTLSGGQQQRVALARALAMQPKLLLLDEPFGGLDLITKQEILKQISQLRARLGFAVVLVTHDPGEVSALCSSLAVLEGGRIAEYAALNKLVHHPQSTLGKAMVQLLKDMQYTRKTGMEESN